MTRVMISQPMYFPWAGFMAQMALADVLIWLDDAQFSKGSFTTRVQVKTAGGVKWMSVPLAGKGSFQLIRDLAAAQPGWQQSHRALLAQGLRGQPQAADALALFDAVPMGGALLDTLIASAEAPAAALGVLPPLRLRSSQMQVGGQSWDRVLKLVQAVAGTDYVTGHGALAYLDHLAFEAAGVRVSYMAYAPLPWPQLHGPFTPYVTVLDLLSSVPAIAGAAHLRPETTDWRLFKASKETVQ